MPRVPTAFLFDLDGTLVDSVYQHVLAWKEALDREGVDLSVWRIHRKIGMSGGLFTNILLRETGLEITEDRLERLRAWHAEAYNRQAEAGAIRPLPGAPELLAYLSAEEIPWAVSRAFYIARSGRPGPVVLDITKDAQINKFDYSYSKTTFLRSYLPFPEPEMENIRAAAELINQAERPFALVGQGVILGNAEQELLAFLEKGGIPFGSTILGLSAIPTDHPLNTGMLGMHGNIAPNMNTNACDVLIAIGMRFDDRVTGNLKTYARQAKIIHFDIDLAEMDKNVKTTVKVLGDAKATLPLVTELIGKRDHSAWLETFNQYRKREFDCVIKAELYPENGGELKMGEVINKVSEATGHKAICVTDVGQHQMMATRYFKSTLPRSMVTSGGLGTMGFGLPAGIGAKYGAPDRTVCIFVGDGGFQMSIQELGTILEYQVDVKIILLNNNYLGMVRQWQELFFDERYSETHLKNPDFVKVAEAYGIRGRKVTDRSELDGAIREMLEHRGPYLLEAVVETKGMVYPMVPAGGSVTDILIGNGNKI